MNHMRVGTPDSESESEGSHHVWVRVPTRPIGLRQPPRPKRPQAIRGVRGVPRPPSVQGPHDDWLSVAQSESSTWFNQNNSIYNTKELLRFRAFQRSYCEHVSFNLFQSQEARKERRTHEITFEKERHCTGVGLPIFGPSPLSFWSHRWRLWNNK